ncbi:MAG: flagellar protein [Clostridiales bacterium]|nr:flagellar protein [Clostridiales bacterium]
MSDYNIKINNIIPVGSKNYNNDKDKHTPTLNNDFADILQSKISQREAIKFSKHAQERLISRNVKLTQEDITKIDKAVEKAAKKGVKDTLILLGNTAFIANVKSKTIITAATEETLKENMFTNIDGAIIL